MSLSLLATAGLALAALPVSIDETRGHHSATVSAALKAGCQVQQVHTPAGKTVQQPPLIRCTPEQTAARDALLAPASTSVTRGTN